MSWPLLFLLKLTDMLFYIFRIRAASIAYSRAIIDFIMHSLAIARFILIKAIFAVLIARNTYINS